MNKTAYSLPCSFSARLDSCEDREQIHKTKIHITTQAFWCRQDVERSHPPLNVVFFKLVYLNMQAVTGIFRVPQRGWSSRDRLGVLVSLQASHQSDIWQSLLPMATKSSKQRLDTSVIPDFTPCSEGGHSASIRFILLSKCWEQWHPLPRA